MSKCLLNKVHDGGVMLYSKDKSEHRHVGVKMYNKVLACKSLLVNFLLDRLVNANMR